MRMRNAALLAVALSTLASCARQFPAGGADSGAAHLVGFTALLSQARPPLSTDGLVGHWLFNGTGANSFGPSTAMTLTGGAAYVDNAVSLTLGQDINATVNGANQIATTIALNFYPMGNYGAAPQYDETTMFTGSTGTRWVILAINSSGQFVVRLSNGTYTHAFGTVTPNTWHNAVVALNSSGYSLRVWIDGVAQTPVSYNPAVVLFNSDYGIRVYNASSAHEWIGYLDNILVYNRSITESEAQGVVGVMR